MWVVIFFLTSSNLLLWLRVQAQSREADTLTGRLGEVAMDYRSSAKRYRLP